MTNKIILSVAHRMACDRLGINAPYTRTHSSVVCGEIQAVRLGNRWYVDESLMDEIVANLARKSRLRIAA